MRNIARRVAFDNRPGHVDRSTPRFPRRGIVVKELLVVLAVIGVVWAPFKLLDSLAEGDGSPGMCDRRSLLQYEVPLGDEFVCVVRLVSYQRPESHIRPYYRSWLQVARRTSALDRGFLLEVLSEESPYSRQRTRAIDYSFVRSEALVQACNDRHDESRNSSDPHSRSERVANRTTLPRRITSLTGLADPLRRCVSPDLREGGRLEVASAVDLDHLEEIDDFPLDRLAAAIRTRADHDGWRPVDPETLLPGEPLLQLAPDQQRALAQSFVLRLAAELPAASESKVPRTK